ncbi:MAG TPA: cell division protein FtsK, partial [Gammaproteobacteria bacterium]|nr:cell division protein FtsK [Gammaproteobacteria bacterium]
MHATLTKRIKEAGFLFLAAIGIYMLMALLSYSPEDPGWAFEGVRRVPQNAGGMVGAQLSSILFSLVGKTAYAFPFMLVWAGWMLFRDRNEVQPHPHLWLVRGAGFVLILVGATTLAALHGAGDVRMPQGSGGILGQAIAGAAVSAFSRPGTSLLMLAFLLIGFTLFTGLSWLAVMEHLGGFVLNAGRQARELWLRLGERRQARQMKQERQAVRRREEKR